MHCPEGEACNYIDSPCRKRINQVSDLSEEIRKRRHQRPLRTLSVYFVGDWGVGKDSLALRILGQELPNPKLEEEHPRRRQSLVRDIPQFMHDQDVRLSIRLIPGAYLHREKEETHYEVIHPAIPIHAMVFCFALNSRVSFFSLMYKWIPVSIDRLGGLPSCILVGTKRDRRARNVDQDEARDLKNSAGAISYLKCSAHNNTGIAEVRNTLLYIIRSRLHFL